MDRAVVLCFDPGAKTSVDRLKTHGILGSKAGKQLSTQRAEKTLYFPFALRLIGSGMY